MSIPCISPASAADVGVKEVSLGYWHSGAIKNDGSLWMWGDNGYGHLGDGTTTARHTPVKIMDNVKQVSLGSRYQGDHSGAIKNDGSLWTWGFNSYGQLGDGTETCRETPVKVMDNVKQVSLGLGHTGAIKNDGSLWMWGRNDYGQLGDGTKWGCEKKPIKIMDNVKQVSLGSYHSGAIKNDGSLWMWGNGDSGAVGNGNTRNQHTPVKVMDNVKSISLGGWYSGAIKNDGSLWTWGYNGYGNLGDGTTTNRHTPVKIMDNVKSVSQNGAIKNDGSLWMWGGNGYGDLGDGTTTDRHTPVKIMDNVKRVALGGIHSGAIKNDGSLWMWGDNRYGQLGDGTTDNKLTPVKIKVGSSTSAGTWEPVKPGKGSGSSSSSIINNVSKNEKPTTKAKASALKKLKKKYIITYKGKLKFKIKSNGKLTFKSSKKKIVSVNKKGVATGKRYGTAKITVKEKIKGKKTKKKKVTIKVIPKTPKIQSIKRMTDKNTSEKYWRLKIKKKDSSVTGYQIYASKTKAFPKKGGMQMLLGKKKFSKRQVNLSKPFGNKKTYIKIRTYKKTGKKYYVSAWSNVKIVK